MVHIRYEGRSLDLREKEVGIRFGASDREIKTRVARYLEINERNIDNYVVDRTTSGNLIVRPEAVYG